MAFTWFVTAGQALKVRWTEIHNSFRQTYPK